MNNLTQGTQTATRPRNLVPDAPFADQSTNPEIRRLTDIGASVIDGTPWTPTESYARAAGNAGSRGQRPSWWRFIYQGMIAEVARHAGHADILAEQILAATTHRGAQP